MRHVRGAVLILAILALVAASCSFAPGDRQALPSPVRVTPAPATAPALKQLQTANDAPIAPAIHLPVDFHAYIFAEGLDRPTSLAFGPDGRLYVADQSGSVVAMENRAGREANRQQLIRVGGTLLGIAFRPATRDLYLSTTGRVMVARAKDDGSFGTPTVVVDSLPTGRHQNDQIAFTKDGKWFFVGIGSTCDACRESDSRSASIMRFAEDGSQQEVYAHGLRNPFGLAIHPESGELFATDNGRDVPVVGVPDELNVVTENGNYGWPDCWGRGQGSHCEGTIPPIAEFQEHASADGLAFYTGASFPQDYLGNAFVALWGGNIPVPSVGKRVDRVVLSRTNGQWQGTVTSFASGFDHPIAVAVGSEDGALYVADYGGGQIYRIIWEGR